MEVEDFPFCCKARIICNFGSGHASEDIRVNDDRGMRRDSKELILHELNRLKKRFQNEGVMVIFACPTNHQPEAIEALTEFGFYQAPHKAIHSKKYKRWVGVYSRIEDDVVAIEHYMVPMFYLLDKNSPDYRARRIK